jgi:hypothetical protein
MTTLDPVTATGAAHAHNAEALGAKDAPKPAPAIKVAGNDPDHDGDNDAGSSEGGVDVSA